MFHGWITELMSLLENQARCVSPNNLQIADATVLPGTSYWNQKTWAHILIHQMTAECCRWSKP